MEFVEYHSEIDRSLLEAAQIDYSPIAEEQIYHYTSIDGLKSILQEQTLRFSDIRYLNDKDEIKAAIDIIVSELGAEDRKNLFQIDDQMRYFVCCFSFERDALPLWNYYTKDSRSKGYNIGFNVKKLMDSILRNNPCMDGCYLSCGSVDYSVLYGEMFVKYIKGVVKQYSDQFLKYVSGNNDDDAKTNVNMDADVYLYDGEKCTFVKAIRDDYLCYVKRRCFQHEKEFRIVISVPKKKFAELSKDEVIKYRIGDGLFIPYFDVKYSLDSALDITLSTMAQNDESSKNVLEFSKYCGLQFDSNNIKNSEIPIRY